MKTKNLIFGLMILIFAGIASAYPVSVTLNGNTAFNTTIYHCQNALCSVLDNGVYASEYGTSNTYVINNLGAGQQYFAEYDFTTNKCSVPHTYVNFFTTTSLNSYTYPVTFTKTVCDSSIISFLHSEAGNQQIQVNVSSPLNPPLTGVIIPAMLQSFYSANVKVEVNITNSSGLVSSLTQNKNILTGKSALYDFSFSMNPGTYNVKVNSYSTDCFCSSNVQNERTYSFSVAECSGNNDCGSSNLENNYCSGNNVMSNYSIPTCTGGSCSITSTQVLNETCSGQCSNGACVDIECNNNLDCGVDDFLNQFFCKSGNSFDKFIIYTCNNPGTVSSYCSNSTIDVLNQTCNFGCSNGNCLPAICSVNSDCGSSNLENNYCSGNNVMSNYSIPTCTGGSCSITSTQVLNETCSGQCSNGACVDIECNNNLDCGVDDFLNQLFCSAGNVFDKFIIYTCNNPGTPGSFCSNSTSNVLNQTCSFGCNLGVCLPQTCTIDSDCGNESYSSSYCLQGNVVRNHLIPICENNSCSVQIVTETIDVCNNGCANGECKSSSQTNNNNRAREVFYYCGDGICNSAESSSDCPEDCGEADLFVGTSSLNKKYSFTDTSNVFDNNLGLIAVIILTMLIIILIILIISLFLRR